MPSAPLSNSTRAIEARARRRLATQGLTLVKFRSDSSWYERIGPYAVMDSSHALVATCLELEGLETA